MTLARFCFVSSIPMLLVVGNPEAADITMALATNAPMQGKEFGTSLTKSRHDAILCSGASGSFSGRSHKPCHFRNFSQLIVSAYAN